jgi:hypothetical protein
MYEYQKPFYFTFEKYRISILMDEYNRAPRIP